METLFPGLESPDRKRLSRVEILLLNQAGLSASAKKLLRRLKRRKTKGPRNKTAQIRSRGLQYRLFAEIKNKPLVHIEVDPLDIAGNTEVFGEDEVRWICQTLLDQLNKLFVRPLLAGAHLSTREHLDWWTWLLDEEDPPFGFRHCLDVTGMEAPIFFRRDKPDVDRIAAMPAHIRQIFKAPANQRDALIQQAMKESELGFGLA